MPYKIETYKSVLDKYLCSGVRFIRYTCQPIGKAKVYFPYISVAQLGNYLKDHLFMNGRQAYYKNSMPYSTWRWFTTNYEVQGIDKIDLNKSERFIVIVLDGKAAIVPITSQNFPMAELNHSAVYSLQHKFFKMAEERLCKYGYYRCIFEDGQFMYHDKGLSYELMMKVAQDTDFIGDNLFVDYIKGLTVDEVYPNLKHVQNRYIKRNKGTTPEQNRQDWIDHTRSLFKGMTFSSPQEEAVKAEVIDYCYGIKKVVPSTPKQIEPLSCKSYYTNISMTSEDVIRLCRRLKDVGAIEASTNEMDFLYYLKGEGTKPTKKLRWTAKKSQLVLLINSLCGGNPQWVITCRVFEGLKEGTLRSLLSRLGKHPKFDDKKEKIIKLYIKP